ncbi:PrsW family glutamic-type intramembrane protease [Clostridium sp.]|uniref:PrsW family glutamic-type intramembrane protease n=1 Tax=Clostridium sp. TaxID=1506 RepID=UPI002A831D60|nr:PrsW family glutamic-type intramembrane protease [Clostridium sp.]MDY4253648.1 PrsW family glutamic-type intramembrane protease [Clostridium sp.]
MENYLISNLLFLISSIILFNLLTFKKNISLLEGIKYLIIVIVFVIPLTLIAQSNIMLNYVADSSLAATLTAPIEEITKLIPILFLCVSKKIKEKNISDYIFIGAISGIFFMVIENLGYKRIVMSNEFFLGISTISYLDFSISFSHIISTVFISIFIGLAFTTKKKGIKKLVLYIFSFLSLIYIMFEHGFYNYVMSNYLFGIIEYDKANIYSKIHDLTGKNIISTIFVLIFILSIGFISLIKESKFKTILIKLKEDIYFRKKLFKKGSLLLLYIIIIVILWRFNENISDNYWLLGILEGILGDMTEILKIIFLLVICVLSFFIGPLIGGSVVASCINLILGSFLNTSFGKKIREKYGDKSTNIIAAGASVLAAAIAVGVLAATVIGATTLTSGILALVGLGLSVYAFMSITTEIAYKGVDEYVKNNIDCNAGLSKEFIISIVIVIMTLIGAKGNLPENSKAIYTVFENIGTIVNTNNVTNDIIEQIGVDNFSYNTIYDTWNMDKVTDEYRYISTVKDSLNNTISIDLSNLINRGDVEVLSEDQKIVLGTSIIVNKDYEEFKYGSNKLLYNEENGLIILTDKKDKIMDIQSLPKEFIYSLLKEDIDKKDIENLVDENIKSLEEDSLNTDSIISLLVVKKEFDLDKEVSDKIDNILNSLDKEEIYMDLEFVRHDLVSKLISNLDFFNEEEYEYSEAYRLNKIASLISSKNAEISRDYIDFSISLIESIDDYLGSSINEVEEEQLNTVLEAYKERSSSKVLKHLNYVIPYRLINKYE